MGDSSQVSLDTELEELRNKLNTLMCSDYKSNYDEVLALSMQLDKLIYLAQIKT